MWLLINRFSVKLVLGFAVLNPTYLLQWYQNLRLTSNGLDLNTEGLIRKRSSCEFNECAALVAHWDD